MDDFQRMRDALAAVGLNPDTLPATVILGEGGEVQEEEVPSSLMRRRVTYTPLSMTEIDALSTVFTTAPQSRVPGSVILNGLIAHACGESWDNIGEAQAVRMRLRRSARRGELKKVADYVRERPDVFGPERVELFRRIAAMEADLRRRNAWL